MTNIGICNVNEAANAAMEEYAQLVGALALAEANLRLHLDQLAGALGRVLACQDSLNLIRGNAELKRREFTQIVGEQFCRNGEPLPDECHTLIRRAQEWLSEER